jgi:hypothetical protein
MFLYHTQYLQVFPPIRDLQIPSIRICWYALDSQRMTTYYLTRRQDMNKLTVIIANNRPQLTPDTCPHAYCEYMGTCCQPCGWLSSVNAARAQADIAKAAQLAAEIEIAQALGV